MLVVTRRKGQRIVIGGDIEVIVTDLSKGSVRLAIRAPAQTTILRGEVHDSIEEANRAAAESTIDLSLLGIEPTG